MKSQKPQPFNNLTKHDRTEWSERDDIVITKADKGGAVVTTDVKPYIREAEYQLKKARIIMID